MRVFFIVILVSLFQLCAYAQSNRKQERTAGETFWLRHALIFFSGQNWPRVLPDNIVFVDDCDKPLGASIATFSRGIKVEVISADRNGDFAIVTFKAFTSRHSNEIFELRLKNSSDKSYRKAFDLVFSRQEISNRREYSCFDYLKTKKQVLSCLGFPISNCKVGKIERLSYTLEFLCCGYFYYDTCTIEIYKGKVINISGTI